jgi:endonuclease G, mitochondrial
MPQLVSWIFSFLIITCSSVKSVKQVVHEPESTPIPTDSSAYTIPFLEWPQTQPEDEVITHTGFSLLYDESHEQAQWVAYTLTLEKSVKAVERTNRFKPDPKVTTGTATNSDYTGSGYDRGHLAPAADMSWSAEAMDESFYFSNISPQTPSFNRGVWKRLEERVRQWAIDDSIVYIVTGPVLKEGLPTIGENKVSVPEHFYKVLLVYKPGKTQGIGFILPNAGSSLPLAHFAVSIDSVESATGLNFFHALPDDVEEALESTLCLPCWPSLNKP